MRLLAAIVEDIYVSSPSDARFGTKTSVHEHFWANIKKGAASWAASEAQLPSPEECLAYIERTETTLRCSLPDRVRVFYASEFYEMVVHWRERYRPDRERGEARIDPLAP